MIKEELLHQLKKLLSKLAGIGVAVLVPLALLLNGLAWSISPVYPYQAYDSLPPDAAGWSQEERLDLALLTLAYLQHPEPAETAVRFLEKERLPGTQEPLYNERELAHLVDVKRLTDGIIGWRDQLNGWLGLGLLLLLAWPRSRLPAVRAMQRGAAFSLALLCGVALLVSLLWPQFFYGFHLALFPPGSWTFAGSDSLIRLFPEVFWLRYAEQVMTTLLVSAGAILTGTSLFLIAAELTRKPATPTAVKPEPDPYSQPSPLPIEQLIYFSDLAAYGRPPDCDDDDKEDNLPW
jgi:hypothetical protein